MSLFGTINTFYDITKAQSVASTRFLYFGNPDIENLCTCSKEQNENISIFSWAIFFFLFINAFLEHV